MKYFVQKEAGEKKNRKKRKKPQTTNNTGILLARGSGCQKGIQLEWTLSEITPEDMQVSGSWVNSFNLAAYYGEWVQWVSDYPRQQYLYWLELVCCILLWTPRIRSKIWNNIIYLVKPSHSRGVHTNGKGAVSTDISHILLVRADRVFRVVPQQFCAWVMKQVWGKRK